MYCFDKKQRLQGTSLNILVAIRVLYWSAGLRFRVRFQLYSLLPPTVVLLPLPAYCFMQRERRVEYHPNQLCSESVLPFIVDSAKKKKSKKKSKHLPNRFHQFHLTHPVVFSLSSKTTRALALVFMTSLLCARRFRYCQVLHILAFISFFCISFSLCVRTAHSRCCTSPLPCRVFTS